VEKIHDTPLAGGTGPSPVVIMTFLPPAKDRMMNLVSLVIMVSWDVPTQELPYRAIIRLRRRMAITIPRNGISPGRGRWTTSARQIWGVIMRT
jgi:hypothetical protein